MNVKCLFLLLVLSGFSISPLRAAGKNSLTAALLDFSSGKALAEQTENVKNRIWFRLITAGVATMLEPATTRDAVIAQNRGAVGYRETAAAARIGTFLRADYVIFGTLGRPDPEGGFIIYVRVVNSESGVIVHADSQTYDGPARAHEASDMLAGRLLQALETIKTGHAGPRSTGARRSPGFALHLTGGYAQPLGEFTRVAGPGWCVLAAPGIACGGFFAGFRSGYIDCSSQGSYDSAALVPLTAMFLYSFELPKSFSVDLTISGGLSFKSLEGKNFSRDGFGPLFMGGAYLGYSIHRTVRLVLGAEGGVAFERRDRAFLLVQGGFMFSIL